MSMKWYNNICFDIRKQLCQIVTTNGYLRHSIWRSWDIDALAKRKNFKNVLPLAYSWSKRHEIPIRFIQFMFYNHKICPGQCSLSSFEVSVVNVKLRRGQQRTLFMHKCIHFHLFCVLFNLIYWNQNENFILSRLISN